LLSARQPINAYAVCDGGPESWNPSRWPLKMTPALNPAAVDDITAFLRAAAAALTAAALNGLHSTGGEATGGLGRPTA
jgi:hypothetical protein